MSCKYLINDRCSLAEKLTLDNIVIIPSEQHCKICSEELNSQYINRVTSSLAIGHLSAKYGKDIPAEFSDQISILKVFVRRIDPIEKDWDKIGRGVGSWIHKILKWIWIKPIPGCKCIAIAEEMNKHDTNWTIQYNDELNSIILKNAIEWMHYKVNTLLMKIYRTKIINFILMKTISLITRLAIYFQQREERNSNEETPSQIGSFTG